MRLVVFSHKPCWPSIGSPTGFATDGGFPYQMKAISQLFDEMILVLPQRPSPGRTGEIPLIGHNARVVPLTNLPGRDLRRKLLFPFWVIRNLPTLVGQAVRADAIHTPIPGDIGTFGMFMALLLRKPLFVRHCGNWLGPRTAAERFWIWFMQRIAGGHNVMFATGHQQQPPSHRNPHIRWIFATSLSEQELRHLGTSRKLATAGPIRLITVSRQEPDKGTDLVIRSLHSLVKTDRDFHLDVVGDGTYLPALKRFVTELALTQHVTFHGKVSHEQVLFLLQQAHLFCYPTSASEGFPKVVLEALATGLPVISTRVSALPYLLSGGGGILIEEATIGAVEEAIEEILSNEKVYQEMSLQAIRTAQSYSLEQWQLRIGERLAASWGPLQEVFYSR